MGRIDYSSTYVHKFGNNADIDTGTVPEDVWSAGGAHVWPAAANTTTIVSDNAADAAAGTGARTVRVYGLDSAWANMTEDVTLNGISSVELSNDFLRVYRAKVLTAGTGGVNTGVLTIAIDGTTAATIPAATGQTLHALFTSAAGELWELVSLFASIAGKTSGAAEIALQSRTDGEAWQTKFTAQITENAALDYRMPVPLIIPPQTDVRVRVLDVGANDTAVSAAFALVRIRP